ncbi:MAG TPA: autotransporter-associated beta strand repeat-containing protein, partial [Rariglobus sp.]
MKTKTIPLLLPSLVLLGGFVSSLDAQSVFTTDSTAYQWGVAGNWSPSGIPTGVDAAVVFNSPVGGNQNISSYGTGRTIGSFTINNDSANSLTFSSTSRLTFDVSSGNASLTVNGTTPTAVAFTSNTPFTLNDNLLITVNNTSATDSRGALSIAGIIDGTGRIIKAGAGKVSLTGTNTFTGGLTINAGTVRVTGASGIGAAPASFVADQVVLDGGTLQFDGSSNVSIGSSSTTSTIGFTLGSNNGEIAVTNSGSYNLHTVIAGGGSLTKSGTGTLYLNGASTYSGGTVIKSGSLRVGVSASLGSGTVTLGSVGGGNASLISNLGGYTYANNITVASGSGGTLTLGSDSTSAYNTAFSGALFVGDNLTVTTSAPSGNRLSFTGILSGTGNITKTGTGELRLTNDNTWTGNLAISEGSVNLTSTGQLRFALADGGVSNHITGVGSATFNGTFVIDDSALTGLGSWQLVDTSALTTTFGSSFTLTVLNGETFTEQGDGTTFTLDGWTFDTLTGILTLSASQVPEPSVYAALAGL